MTTINILLDRNRMLCLKFDARDAAQSYAKRKTNSFEEIQRRLDGIKSLPLPIEDKLRHARLLLLRKRLNLNSLKDTSISYHYMRFKGE